MGKLTRSPLVPPPARLPSWSDADRRSRLVFITQNIGQDAVKAMLDAWAGFLQAYASRFSSATLTTLPARSAS